jgi:hypothetical protein
MNARPVMSGAACALLLLLGPLVSWAQTSDDLFNDDTVHRIDLWINSRDWAQLRANYLLDDFYPANLRWRGLTARNVGIRSRGTGSRDPGKPGLHVNFDHYTAGGEFLGLKSLVLDNLKQDPSGIHETVTMAFFRRMGLPAPRESHVALYVNNAYFGLYAAVEVMDDEAMTRMFGEHDGYLFEYRWSYIYYLEYLGPDLDQYAPLFEAKNHKDESVSSVYAPIEAMIRTINESFDDQFVAAVSEYLDLYLFMKFTAIQSFLAEWDGVLGYAGVNYFYLYRFDQRNVSQFIPWDEDNTFRALDYPILQGHAENVLMRRAMTYAELRNAYFDTLLASADSADQVSEPPPDGGDAAQADGWLEREIARQLDLVRPFALADHRKPFTNEEFEQAAADMLAFGRARSAFVRCEVNKLNDPQHAGDVCAPPPEIPPAPARFASPRRERPPKPLRLPRIVILH